MTIDVNLTNDPVGQTPAGQGGGFAPLVKTVTVGTTIRFVNADGFNHTSTSIPGFPPMFPNRYPFDKTALTQSGQTLSGAGAAARWPQDRRRNR